MALFTDPRQVTNWLDPLEKNYNEQRRQRELHHSQSKEVWRQEEAATFTADLANEVLKGISSLSKTAKAISTQREEFKYKDFVKGYEQLKFTDQEKIEQIASETDLSLKGTDLINTLRKEGLGEEALGYLELQSGHKSLRLKRLLGWQTVEKSVATIDNEIEQNLYGLRDQYNEAERTGKVNILYKNLLTDKLRKLGLNDRFIATHYEPEINKFADTKGLSSRLDYKSVQWNQNAEEEVAGFEKLKYNKDTLTASTHFDNFLKTRISLDTENGRSNAVIFMHRLMKDGKIDGSVIQNIKDGAVISDVGKTGVKLLSDSDWRYIEQGEKEYQAAVITAHNDSWAAQGLTARTAVIKNEWNQNQFENFLRKAKDNGQENQQWFKDLSKINVNRQNENVYESENEQLIEIAETGNLEFLKAEVESFTNSTAKDAALKEIAFQEKQRKKLNYSERFLDVKVSEGLNLTLKTDEALNWKGIGVRNDLLAFFRKDFATRIKADPNNPNALGESMQAVEDYWEANGGNEQGGVGKFSPTSNGTYDNFNNYNNLKSEAYTELNTIATESNVKKYTDRVNTAWNKAKYDTITKGKNIIQRVLNTPESILDKEDIIAAYENTTISSEVRIKARELGITPTQLLEWQTKALINGGDTYKEVVDLFDLKNKELPDPEKDLQDMIDDQDLLYLLRRVGIENTTPKQRFRLYQYLENNEASVKEKNIENTLSESSNTQPDIGRYSTRSN